MPSPVLKRLLEAKRLSDQRRYGPKNSILAGLLRENPNDFQVKPEGRIASVSHPSTGFRIHMLSAAVPASDEPAWKRASSEGLALADQHRSTYVDLRSRCAGLSGDCQVLFNPDSGEVHVDLDQRTRKEAAQEIVDRFPSATICPHGLVPNGYPEARWIWVKRASDPILSSLAQLTNFQPGQLNTPIAGPSPLASLLASGVLGAGIGYGVGALGEQLLPERSFYRGVLRRNAALLGAGSAVAPSLLWGLTNYQSHPEYAGQVRSLLSSWPHGGEKKAAIDQGLASLATMPAIPKDEFGRIVWQDNRTPVSIRAATTGLLDAASHVANRDVLSPMDIARVTATGAVNGLVVGKTLGALAGLKPEAQNTLQQVGVWGSLLSAVVPNAFPSMF